MYNSTAVEAVREIIKPASISIKPAEHIIKPAYSRIKPTEIVFSYVPALTAELTLWNMLLNLREN